MVAGTEVTTRRWNVAGACVRGASHIRSGSTNQDAIELVDADQQTPAIAAVADGHGSRVHFRSDKGSSFAVSSAVATIRKCCDHYADGTGLFRQDLLQHLQQEIVEAWISAVQSDLQIRPFTSEDLQALEEAEGSAVVEDILSSPVKAYGATLLVAVANAFGVLYLQLGDGEILTVDSSGATSRPVPRDDRLSGNGTTSLCMPEAWKEFRSAVSLSPRLPALVLLSTDGYVNSFRSDEDFLQIGADYLEMLRNQGVHPLQDQLPSILEEASHDGSGDDITLALLAGNLESAAPQIDSGTLKAGRVANRQDVPGNIENLQAELLRLRIKSRRLAILSGFLVLMLIAIAAVVYGRRVLTLLADNSKYRRLEDPGKLHRPSPLETGTPVDKPHLAIRLASGKTLQLQPGSELSEVNLGISEQKKTYAEVQDGFDHALTMVNRSADTWTVKDQPAREHRVHPTESLVLHSGQKFVFRTKISATIADSGAKSSASAPPADAGSTRP